MNLDVVDLDSHPKISSANACFALMARCRVAVLLCGLLAFQPLVQQRAAAKDLGSDLVATSIRDLNDKSARVRANAATNLHNIGPSASGAVPKLVSMLSTERDADVRLDVADAIGAAGRQSPEAVPALIRLLQHEREHEVRSAAAKALGRMGLSLELSVPALIAALKDDAEDVRAAAAEALGAKAFATGAPTIVPALVGALSDEAGAVRGNAGAGLVELGPNAVAAVPELRKLLADPTSKDGMALLAARILGAIGSGAAPAAPECLAALGSETPELRIEAAIALLAFGQHVRPAMDELVKSLRFNDDRSVTQNLRNGIVVEAAWAIGAHAEDASGADAMSLAMGANETGSHTSVWRACSSATVDRTLRRRADESTIDWSLRSVRRMSFVTSIRWPQASCSRKGFASASGERGRFPASAPPTGAVSLSRPAASGGGFSVAGSGDRHCVSGDDQVVAFMTSDAAPAKGEAHVYRVSAMQGGVLFGGYTLVVLGG